MTSHEEQLAALRATADQATAAAGEIARTVGAYFKALVGAEGFSREEALTLTLAWQAYMFYGPRSGEED